MFIQVPRALAPLCLLWPIIKCRAGEGVYGDPPLSPFMSPSLFTADDGDVLLCAGPKPESKHDFRVHKLILSLASPVFKDMFASPNHPTRPPTKDANSPSSTFQNPQKSLTRSCNSSIQELNLRRSPEY